MRTLTRPFRFAASRRVAGSPAPRRARRGFTIVEAIVAIVMLAMGVLALVSSSAVVLNQMTVGSQNAIAATVATQRLETMRSYNLCSKLVNGTAATRGMTETWTVETVSAVGGVSSRRVTYNLTFQAGRAQRTQTFVTTIPCT